MEDTEGEVTVRGQVGRVSKQGGKERKEKGSNKGKGREGKRKNE